MNKRNVFLFLLSLLILVNGAYAATATLNANGGWADPLNTLWTGGAGVNGAPAAGDDIIIANGVTLTMDANSPGTLATVTINGTSANSSIVFAGFQMDCGAISINAPTSNFITNSINIGNGTLNCTSITLANTANGNRDCEVTLSTGTINCTGNITMSGATNENAVTFTGSGLLVVGGTISAVTLTPSTGTVRYNGAVAVTGTSATFAYYNLELATATAKTAAAAITVSNNLSITAGDFNVAAFAITVTNNFVMSASTTFTKAASGGNMSIGGTLTVPNTATFTFNGTGTMGVTSTSDISGSFVDGNNGAATTFTGLVTISSTGSFTSTSVTTAANMVFTSGLTNSGTCNAGAITIGSGQTLTATAAVSTIGITCPGTLNITGVGGVTVTATGATSITTNLVLSAGTSFTKSGTTGNISIGGTLTIPNTSSFTHNGTGTMGVTSTTDVSGTFTDGDNTNSTTFTGLVTIAASGSFTSTIVTTAANMVFNGGLTNSGTCNLGGATVGAGQTVTATAAISVGNTLAGTGSMDIVATSAVSTNGLSSGGTLNISGVGGVSVGTTGGIAITTNLSIAAGSSLTKGGTTGNISVGGTLTVANTASFAHNGTGTIAVTGTSDISGTFTDSDNTNTTTFTGLVTIAATGTFTSTAVTSTNRISFNGGLTNLGTCNLGSCAIGAAQILTATAAVSIANVLNGTGSYDVVATSAVSTNGLTSGGTINISGAGGVTVGTTGAITTTNDLMIAANSSLAKNGTSGNITIGGAFSIGLGATFAHNGTGSMAVTGITTVNGSFTDSDDAATTTFTGAVTIGESGLWTSTGVGIASTANMAFAGGFTNNNNTVSTSCQMGGARFTADQTIAGDGNMSFANSVRLMNDVDVTNQNTATITITGTLFANNGNSQWINDNGSTVDYFSTAEPMSGGLLDVNNAINTFRYSSATTANIYEATYSNLVINVGTSATIASAIVIDNQLTLTSGSFSVGAFLTMTDNATISRGNGSLTAAPTFGANINIVYTAALTTSFEMPTAAAPASGGVLNNLTMNTSGNDVTLGANVSMKGTLTWSSNGKLILSTFTLRMNETSTFSGNNSNRFVQTNSTGTLIKEGDATAEFTLTYPLGTGSNYTPMQVRDINSGAFGTPGTLTMRAVGSKLSYVPVSNNAITKYWDVTSSFTPTANSVDLSFTFVDPTEVVGSIAAYVPRYGDGASISDPTGAPASAASISAAGTTPTFTVDDADIITGQWTYVSTLVITPKTYYSYQSGDWADPATWTTDPGGALWTNDGTEYPGKDALDDVVILNSRTVFTLVDRTVDDVQIDNGGILDMRTTASNTFDVVSGQGTLRLNSVTLPSGTYTSFVASTGGTIEYYDIGGSGTNLSASQLTYNNLLITNSTGTNHTLILPNPTNPTAFTINGNITLSRSSTGTATLQMAYTATNVINLNVSGNITVGTGCAFTVGSYNAAHTLTITGNITANGTFDLANNSAFSAQTTGACHVTFTGASNSTFTCNSAVQVFSLTVNKGTDQTYSVHVTAPSGSFAFTTNGAAGPDGIVMTNGTLILGTGVTLTRLTGSNSNINISSALNNNACLKIDGATVTHPYTINLYGKLWMVSGNATFGNNGINMQNNSEFDMDGGTLTLERIINGGAGNTVATIDISGGTINIDNTPSFTGVNDLPRLSLASPNVTFIMSAGTVNVRNPVNDTYCENGGITLASTTGNFNVTGGTWNVYVPNGTAGLDDFYISSTVPFYDLNIYETVNGPNIVKLDKVGGDIVINAQPLVVLNNLTINDAAVFDANGNSVTVGGNFTIAAGASYLPNANTTTFNGSSAQSLTIGAGSTITRSTNLTVNKTGGALTMATTTPFNTLSALTLTAGNIVNGGFDIDVTGNVSVSDSITGSGALTMQRGVTAASVTAGGSYTLPTLTRASATTDATFALTIKDGVVTDISIVSGGTGYTANAIAPLTVAGGGGAGFTAASETNGAGVITSVWVLNGGSGYGPTAGVSGGGGSGVVLQAVVTGNTSNVAGTGALTAVNVLARGEGYTSNPTITISSGAATATANTTFIPTIGGSGAGSAISNLSLNNDQGATFTANQIVTGNVRLLSGVLDIASFNLSLSGTSNIYSDAGTSTSFSNTKMIRTGGLVSNAGITKTYSASMLAFTFPLGTAADYTPGSVTLSAAPTAYGSVTMRPVASEHPLVSNPNRCITYYWKTSSAGFTLGTATVSQTYTYVDADVLADAGDRAEADYVIGRYNPASASWSKGVTLSGDINAPTNLITTPVSFNGVIDGEYTCGDDDATDPFGTVLTFYSKDGAIFDWNSPGSWSTVSHTGAAETILTPSANSIVQIGDATYNNHVMSVNNNSMLAGVLKIAAGCTLDVKTNTGCNFGTYIDHPAGNGTIRISSAAATAEFPAGDYSDFLDATGGTLEYYTTGAQDFNIPTTSAAPSSAALNSYFNLRLTPATGRYITMPDLALTINNDFVVNGASATAVARLNTATARTLTITNNLSVTGGNLQFRNGTAQAINVGGSVSVSSGAIFDIENAGTITNTMSIVGSLTNNGTINFAPASANTRVCNLTFTGTGNTSITGTTGVATTLSRVTVNKGTSQTPILTVDLAGTLTVPSSFGASSYEWLTLTNGTFRYNKSGGTLVISNTAATSTFSIPSTACLSCGASATGINVCYFNNANADVILTGKLEVLGGTVNVGNSATNQNNDIEIDQAGTPTIDVQGSGALYVNGAIRRSTSSAAGTLIYSQAGTSTVTIGGRNNSAAQQTRGKLEICNTGSSFNMSGTSILEIRVGNGTDGTFGDLYIAPTAASAVSSGTLIRFVPTNLGVNQTFGINTNISLANITVDGFDANDLATCNLLINPLTLSGNLVINDAFSAFAANGISVNIAGNLTNSNTTATTGTTVGGYRPGSATQVTTFNSTTATQTITGTATPNLTNFGRLVINNSFGAVSLAANTALRVNGDLTISTALADGGNTITVIGNISNSSTHTGAGKITLGGSSQQILSGTGGSYNNLELNNTAGAVTSSNQTVNGVLTLTSGILDIDDDLLTLGVSATIGGTPSVTRMIVTNGSTADAGIIKNYPASSALDFTFPIGFSTTKYTPARLNVTANGAATGTITCKVINTKHPSTQDAGNLELTYYWYVVSTGFSSPTVTHVYTYDQSDVFGTESSYVIGRFDLSIGDWNEPLGVVGGVVDHATNNTLTITGASYINGEFTAGESTEFAGLAIYYSGSTSAPTGGNWTTASSWTTDPGAPYNDGIDNDGSGTPDDDSPASTAPSGSAVVIRTGHTITITSNSRRAGSTTVAGTGILNVQNFIGTQLGAVSGTGTIRISATGGGSFVFPAGTFTSFVASGGGTFDFSGSSNGTLSTQTTYNNLTITNTATTTMANVDLTVNGNVTISNGVLNNSTNNRNIDLKGNWVNSVGAAAFTEGTGTVTFSGTAAQQITGAETFYNLTCSNTSGDLTLNNNVTVSNTLNFTSGKIIIGNNNLYISSGNAITGATSARYVVTNGSGLLGINSVTTSRAFPIGISTSSYTPATIANTGTTDRFNVRVFDHVFNGDGFTTNQVASDVVDRTWEVTEGVAGGSNVTLTLQWNAVDELAGFGRTSCGIAHFTGGSYDEPAYAAASGTDPYTRSRSGLTSFSPFAVGDASSVLPIELLSFNAKYEDKKVLLNWATATETNNDYFVVEKTKDGSLFEQVVVIDGSGNSISVNNYSATDLNPYPGVSYYRLKQVDFNGAFTYSNLVAVEVNTVGGFSFLVYPNPSEGYNLNVNLLNMDRNDLNVSVYDMSGRKVYEKQMKLNTDISNQNISVSLPERLQSGVYSMVINSGNNIYKQRVIIR